MEYFYNDTLRWSFGFDNPNKSAVLFACVLAFCWTCWMLSGRIKSWLIRVPCLLVSGLLVVAAAFLLFKTYSRGGLIAGACAIAYLEIRSAWASPRRLQWARSWMRAADLVMLGLLVALFWWTGLMDRTLQPLEGADASVENRLILWQKALQMAADNPRGFGVGRSGEAYMNWYQPVEMTAGYRTMVNSYLTALVEWGWPAFFAAALAAALVWGWANPGRRGTPSFDLAGGLRAMILAFAVAGIFSTTMEEWSLWIPPAICLAILVVWAAVETRPVAKALPSLAWMAGMCFFLAAIGKSLSWKDPESRKFGVGGSSDSVQIGPKTGGVGKWAVMSDPKVLGKVPGKLLRPLAHGMGEQLTIAPLASGRFHGVIAAGEAVNNPLPSASDVFILLAPAILQEKDANRLLSAPLHGLIFVPDIDEDGRGDFWGEASGSNSRWKVIPVEGVGLQLDWGWDQVVRRVSLGEL